MIALEGKDGLVAKVRGCHNNNELGQALDVAEAEKYVLMLLKLLPEVLQDREQLEQAALQGCQLVWVNDGLHYFRVVPQAMAIKNGSDSLDLWHKRLGHPSLRVTKLQKSLYGLKQSPRSWFAMLSTSLKEYGFMQSYFDYSLFTLHKNGTLKYFLGIEVARNAEGIFLYERKYALDIISEVGLLGAKPVNVPMESNYKLALAEGSPLADPEKYQ
ncbi:hypothetical protein MTR67_018854 [Solanum verrucosum]|uniref:GAG-pre-integrase domain-containing protein n=1 Tax=Solanum verrucosum TaxID=315347 RepID=A0AAF0QKF2_SOLVR|nr:hypothetical protein MTR67_018854 [Solanum verrucosum]